MVAGIPHGTASDSGGAGESGGAGRLPRPGPAGGRTVGRVVTLVIGSVPAPVSRGLFLARVIGLNLSGVTPQ